LSSFNVIGRVPIQGDLTGTQLESPTHCLESVHSLVEECRAKVDSWKNSNQGRRWLATGLLDIEPRLRRVKGYRHLPQMRQALRRELGLEEKSANREAA